MRYADDTAGAVLLLSLALVPYALSSLCEATLRGWEQMHLIAAANVPANLAKIVVAFVILERGGGLREILLLLVAARVAILLALWALMLRRARSLPKRLDLKFAARAVRASSTFFGIDSLLAIWSSLSVILLSTFTTESEIALFNAAAQLLVPFGLLIESVTTSVFPTLCRQYANKEGGGLQRSASRLLEVLLLISLPGAIGLAFLARPALVIAYGNEEFGAAAIVTQILVGSIVLRALASGLGQVLYASHQERVTLRIVLVNVIIALVLNVVLIAQFGLPGAAAAVLLVRLVNVLQHYVPVRRLLPELRLGAAAWRPAVAAFVLAAILAPLRGAPVTVNVAAGAMVYCAVAAALLWRSGEASLWLAASPALAGSPAATLSLQEVGSEECA
jgi:O-antigen/teichoic acid export membrane protein